MGNNLSLSESDLEQLSEETKYNPDSISGMFKKFGKLDKEEKGYVSTDDLNKVCSFEEDS